MVKYTQDELTALAHEVDEKGPYWLACELGIGYTGDVDAIQHSGLFYDRSNWLDYGYASAVELLNHYDEDDGSPLLLVTQGTINRGDDEDWMRAAQRCAGDTQGWEECRAQVELDPNHPAGLEMVDREIEASLGYSGIEPAHYHATRGYKTDTWRKEWRLWRSILPMILALQEG